MDRKELRIGNLVSTIYGVRKIESIEQTSLSTLIDGCRMALRSFSFSDIRPISLTEEWLLKFGFERTKVPMKWDIEYIDYRMGQFVLFILPKGVVEVEFCAAHNKIEERGYLRAIKYVHQLQNIIFSLTGQELEMNL